MSNTFQAILVTDDNQRTFAVFNYVNVKAWQGSSSAASVNFADLSLSWYRDLASEQLDLTTGSNTGVTGQFMFQINGQTTPGQCAGYDNALGALLPYGPSAGDTQIDPTGQSIQLPSWYALTNTGFQRVSIDFWGSISIVANPVKFMAPFNMSLASGANSSDKLQFARLCEPLEMNSIYYRTMTFQDVQLVAGNLSSAFGTVYGNVQAQEGVVITWNQIINPLNGSERNTFQLAMILDTQRRSYAMFNYKKLQWGGGKGLAAAFLDNYPLDVYAHSDEASIDTLLQRTNIRFPGRWLFAVSPATVFPGTCPDVYDVLIPYGPEYGDIASRYVPEFSASIPCVNVQGHGLCRVNVTANGTICSFQEDYVIARLVDVTADYSRVVPIDVPCTSKIPNTIYYRGMNRNDLNTNVPNGSRYREGSLLVTWHRQAAAGVNASVINTFQVALLVGEWWYPRVEIMLNYKTLGSFLPTTDIFDVVNVAGRTLGFYGATSDPTSLTSMSNYDLPGRWMFRIDGATVPIPAPSYAAPNELFLPYGPQVGDVPFSGAVWMNVFTNNKYLRYGNAGWGAAVNAFHNGTLTIGGNLLGAFSTATDPSKRIIIDNLGSGVIPNSMHIRSFGQNDVRLTLSALSYEIGATAGFGDGIVVTWSHVADPTSNMTNTFQAVVSRWSGTNGDRCWVVLSYSPDNMNYFDSSVNLNPFNRVIVVNVPLTSYGSSLSELHLLSNMGLPASWAFDASFTAMIHHDVQRGAPHRSSPCSPALCFKTAATLGSCRFPSTRTTEGPAPLASAQTARSGLTRGG